MLRPCSRSQQLCVPRKLGSCSCGPPRLCVHGRLLPGPPDPSRNCAQAPRSSLKRSLCDQERPALLRHFPRAHRQPRPTLGRGLAWEVGGFSRMRLGPLVTWGSRGNAPALICPPPLSRIPSRSPSEAPGVAAARGCSAAGVRPARLRRLPVPVQGPRLHPGLLTWVPMPRNSTEGEAGHAGQSHRGQGIGEGRCWGLEAARGRSPEPDPSCGGRFPGQQPR